MRTFIFCCTVSHDATEKELVIILTSSLGINDYQLSFAKHTSS